MRIQRGLLALVGALAIAMALVTGVMAATATISNSGISLTYPGYPLNGAPLASCEPWEVADAQSITLSGVPVGSSVLIQFVTFDPYNPGTPTYLAPINLVAATSTITQSVPYPMDTSQWPYVNQTTNERSIGFGVFVMVTYPSPSTTRVKIAAKNWWVRCQPPARPKEGCTPGYWKQDQHFDSWPATRQPSDDYNLAFGVTASFSPHTLLDALWIGGGGEKALARHAVAGLLNAEAGLNYEFTAAEIIAGVQAAYASGDFETFKNQLDAANNAGCPLN